MKRPTHVELMVAVSGILIGCPPVHAGDRPVSALSGAIPGLTLQTGATPASSQPTPPAKAWRAEMTTWAWLVGMEGDVRLGDRESNVSAGFGDVVEASDSMFAFSGRLELGYGNFGGFVDAMYANLGAEDQSGPNGATKIDVSNELGVVDFGVMYRIIDRKATGGGADSPLNMTLDLYGGGRFTSVSLDLDPANLPTRSRNKSWIDPIVGAKFVVPLADHWHLSVNGDIGGFGAGSDITWSATGVLGYDFRLFDHPATLFTGYRAIGWDFSDGYDADQFKWDMVMHGPLLGFSMRF